MNVAEYEPGFAGFLAAAAALLRMPPRARPSLRPAGSGGEELPLGDVDFFPADEAAAKGLWAAIRKRIRGEPLERLADAFLSEMPGIEDHLVEYIEIALERGMAIEGLLAERAPLAVEKAARRARSEVHRFLGLVRFSELADGSLYAEIEPDCAVLPRMSRHFSERFPGFFWVIRDLRRDEALFHEKGREAVLLRGLRIGGNGALPGPDGHLRAPEGEPPLSDRETAVRAAWKEYFNRVSIKERANPRLQMGHMPKKHWKHLPEMEGRA